MNRWKFGYWVLEVAGTLVCIAAFINIVLRNGDPVFYYFVFITGLLIVFAGLPLGRRAAAHPK